VASCAAASNDDAVAAISALTTTGANALKKMLCILFLVIGFLRTLCFSTNT
jgi:hypothetical protein